MRSTIYVSRCSDIRSTYIGRPSPLGNPFVLENEEDRDLICDTYDSWLNEQVAKGNKAVIDELMRLKQLNKTQGYLVLGCYCFPKRCHGDSIKRLLDMEQLLHDKLLAY